MLQPPDIKPRSTTLGVLVPFGIVTLIWGSTWLVIRDQLGVVPPSWSVTYRFLIAGVCMAGWALWKRESWRLGTRGYGFAVLLGLLNSAVISISSIAPNSMSPRAWCRWCSRCC